MATSTSNTATTDTLTRLGSLYGFFQGRDVKPGRAEHLDLKAIFGESSAARASDLELQGLKHTVAIGTGTDALLNEWACAAPMPSARVLTALGFGECLGELLGTLRQASKGASDPTMALDLRRATQELSEHLANHDLAYGMAHQLMQG